jgi:hypothetical protein
MGDFQGIGKLNQAAKPVGKLVTLRPTGKKRQDVRFAHDRDNETGFIAVQPVVAAGCSGPWSGT